MEQNINISSTSEYIAKTIASLNDLFKRIDEFKKENPEKTFGYAGIPYCLDRVRETGVDKIFFVSSDYHGRYEDDDCYFTYWDEDNKEFFNDEWSTRFAAPAYDYYEMPIDFAAGWESGMIDKEAYLNIMKSIHLDILNKETFNNNVAKNYNLRVSVEGGRKFKGEGYLVRVDKSSYRFAHPMYRNHNEDYGLSTTYTAVIWNPIDNTINRANFNYVNFLDKDIIMEKYINWAKNIIENATIDDIKNNNRRFILSVDYSFEKFMNEVWNPDHNIGDVVSNAYDPEMEEKKKKESEYRASKMPGIIEWVKNNTDKQGEDIIKLAIHIFEKNN